MADPFLAHLAGIVGAHHVLTAPDELAGYTRDWTGRYAGEARCVVRPANTDEVAAVVRACAREGAAIVPQGGNTGLVGGGVPYAREVVLSASRLTWLDPVDPIATTVAAGAGVTIEALQQHARAAGLAYGVDLASRGTAQLGGTIATNAGGVRVLRYGATRHQLVGIEAVFPNGEVVTRMSGLHKDNSGYDLPQLLCGSEGTLGVVTGAVVRLVPPNPERAVALLALDGLDDTLDVFARIRRQLPEIEAAEAFFAEGLDLVCEHARTEPPFAERYPCYLLLEAAAQLDPTERLAAALLDAPGIRDSALATDSARRAALWRYRESHTESINAEGVPHKLDVTLPLPRLAEFERGVRARIHDVLPGARAILFGHIGDGNLHVNILGAEPDDERPDDAVMRYVAELGGSISAEHGIGIAKKRWLHLTRSEPDIAAMRALKHALDPQGIMNPEVLFPG